MKPLGPGRIEKPNECRRSNEDSSAPSTSLAEARGSLPGRRDGPGTYRNLDRSIHLGSCFDLKSSIFIQLHTMERATVVYPHSTSKAPSSNSKGSFAPVFVVLGIVAVLTAVACIIGQVCARRYLRPRHRRDHAPYYSDDGDLEGRGRPASASKHEPIDQLHHAHPAGGGAGDGGTPQ
ncbi:uncharacterized protein A4U43_C01F36370 [Asparagus officinalis]|uniref:Uncharacterized protein n=1 Tax=Asparagus officinalis TaxID=4686 RepID=A0A5P1FUU9_ASPOF|nr:uncharacterized protein A4U43_C01F36370 [Asparagus officinalis]